MKCDWLFFPLVSFCLLTVGATPATRPATGPSEKRDNQVVFVVDATGSMVNKWADVVEEVSKAIANLRPEQSFTIYVLTDGKVVKWSAAYVRSGAEPASKAHQFLAKFPTSGDGTVEPPILAALGLKPDLIWVATDGDWQDGDQAVVAVKRANARTKVRINAVVFGRRDEENWSRVWRLARENGGICMDETGKKIEQDPATPPPAPKGPSILKE